MRGEPASDLVSAYLTMDIPIFTGNRQDNNLQQLNFKLVLRKYQKDTLFTHLMHE